MRNPRRVLLLCASAALSLAMNTSRGEERALEVDPASGLRIAAGWEMARAHCGGCHSYRLVTANRGDRDYWRNTLRWMQRTQNLWLIPPEQENSLLDYLAANYNESEWGRRPPLSPALLPH